MRLGLISGGYPPALDGIGDYTWWLAQTLAAQPDVEGPVRVFTAIGPERTPAPGVEVFPFFDLRRPASFGDLLSSSAIQELDWLVLQYNPFSFGARGWCPSVPRTLARLRRLPRGPKIAVMFHETVVPRWPWKFALMHSWQQPIFRAVCRAADLAFVSTERWTPQVRRVAPRLPVHHAPVGSNIPLSQATRAEARRTLGIEDEALVLGIFGSAHVSRRLDWVAATLREATLQNSGARTLLLYVGAAGKAVREACPKADCVDCGAVASSDVGPRLRAMDAAISPFVDGMSTRRGSVISTLHHGIPVATTRSEWTDALLLTETPNGFLLSAAESAEEFAHETMDWMKQVRPGTVPNTEVLSFFNRHFSWPVVASKMVKQLA